MAYSVGIEPAAKRAVAKLPKQIRAKIADRVELLGENPRPYGAIKLSGEDAYRIRVGDYRIIYTIHDDQLIVLVIDVGNRKDVYRRGFSGRRRDHEWTRIHTNEDRCIAIVLTGRHFRAPRHVLVNEHTPRQARGVNLTELFPKTNGNQLNSDLPSAKISPAFKNSAMKPISSTNTAMPTNTV